MEIVGENRIVNVIATNEQYTYEAEKLISEVYAEKWRAHNNSATLYCGVSASSTYPCDTFFIKGTNAVTITVTKGNHLDGSWADSTTWDSINSAAWQTYTYSSLTSTLTRTAGTGYKDLYGEYAEETSDHVIKVVLTAASGSMVEAGVVFAGGRETFRDANLTVVEGLYDYSVKYPLNHGANYVDMDAEDVVRTFTGSFDAAQETELRTYLNMLQKRGSKPMIWRVFSKSLTGSEWVGIGSVVDLSGVSGAHDRPGHSLCSFTVREER